MWWSSFAIGFGAGALVVIIAGLALYAIAW